MSDSRFVITGAVGGSPNRLEINDFVKNDKFFSLFIQALQAMSKQDQSVIQSFFQVGGIHGLPYITWDDATGAPTVSGQWEGYCTHGTVLFPTWHRPYMMLYEQILQQRAIEVAATYQVDPDDWKQAAIELRHPFWDWAKNSVPPDEVIALQQVTITTFDGQRVQTDNPLYHYTFHPIDPSFPAPFSGWVNTLRYPTSTDPDATDNVDLLKSTLASAQVDITSKTYNMLTRVTTWPAFSNHTEGDGGSTSNSLEAIHDGIHFDIGGPNGHMTEPALSGFDPIFFLHHANVDRLLSLWSALHPGVWVTPGDSEAGSWTIPQGVAVDENTALTPFWNTQTTFWPSSVIADTSKLGYTYPEFNGLDIGNIDLVTTAISVLVNLLYGVSLLGTSAVEEASPSAAPQPGVLSTVIDYLKNSVVPRSLPANDQPFATVAPNRGPWDWTARIEFKPYEVGTSFAILLFLGEVPEDPKEWHTSSSYVGSHAAFVNSVSQRCANCRNQQDIVVEGFVHLNDAIVRLSGLKSLGPGLAEPYLTKGLNWRVQRSDGADTQIESLEVVVFSTPLSYPLTSLFPVPGEATRHNQITYGKPGGSRDA